MSERLGRLLAGDLPEEEQFHLTAHLEDCPECRKALDALAARSGLWKDLPLLRDEESDQAGWPTPPENEPGGEDDEVPLGLLGPADKPGHLGTFGPYDVLSVVGRGGMGVVFKARDRALDRLVAIKVLAPGLATTASARRRFAREAKAAAAVVHEHVVTIHAVDTTPQGIPYLVMQYIAGKSVQQLIDRGRPPELREILRIGSQAASGLAAAHAQGLIHRDIKPANLLLENGVERVKITDFGLARAVDDATMTQSGVVAGTPQYMSPEQARGESIDHRTDLFSLGSVLYALCTGGAPFRGRSSMATLKRVCEEKPEPVGQLNPEIPPWLVRIIDKLHAKSPADRYNSAAEVADLLGRCLAHVQQPSSVSLPEELCPPRRRRALAAWGLLPLGLTLALVLGFSNVRAAAQRAVDYVATVLRIKTAEGVLVVEADDPDIGIKLDGGDLVVTGAGLKELRLAIGPHHVQALKDGRVVREDLVTISRGGRTLLTIHREPESGPPPTALNKRLSKPAREGVPETKDLTPVGSGPNPDAPAILTSPMAGDRPAGIPRPTAALTAIGAEVRSAVFSPDGRLLAYGLKDGRIGIWDWQTMKGGRSSGTHYPSFMAHPGGVECLAFAPDGQTLASGGWDHKVALWEDAEADGLAPKPRWDFAGYADGVRSLAFSPDGRLLAAGGFDRILTVLDAKTGLRIWTSPTLEQPINGVTFSPDERFIALALGDYSKGVPGNLVGQPGEVQVWRWPGRTRVASFGGWTRECKSVAFNSEGTLLAATCADGTTKLYEIGYCTLSEKATLQSGPFTAGLGFRPDGQVMATSNWSGEVKLWNPESQKVRASFQAHDQNIPCLEFSPDGRYLATAGAEGSIKVWDVGEVRAARVPGSISAARRLAEVLKDHPPRHSRTDGIRLQVYLRDMTDGGTTLVADEPFPGLIRTSGPKWSSDGRRIVFHASPEPNDWQRSQMILLEAKDGKPSFRSLGTGNCPDFSPDGSLIAYLAWPGSAALAKGVFLGRANGSEARRVSDFVGAPYWSPRGDKLLINGFTEPTECQVLDLTSGKQETISVEGYTIMSWPRWVGPDRVLAVIRGGGDEASIALLDVRRPSRPKILRIFWNRSKDLNFLPRWPVYEAARNQLLFVGVEWPKRRNLYSLLPDSGKPAVALQTEAHEDQLEGLFYSPGGRYLLFNANRPDRK
jgi:dipeptidyl aminopeptidase/acylaminoacyl peptidase